MDTIRKIFNTKLGADGFSLMEVMVGGAILVGASLAAVKIFADQRNAQKRIELDRVLDAQVAVYKMNLASRKNCNLTLFGFLPPTTYSSSFPSTLTSLRMITATSPSGVTLISNGGYINDQRTHRLNSISVVMESPGNTGLAKLTMNFTTTMFGTTVIKNLFFPVKLSSTGMYECLDDQAGVEKTLQKEGCEAMGVYGDYEADGQTCANRNIKNLDSAGVGLFHCPPSEDVVGITPAGEVICANVNSRFVPSVNAVAPATPNCNGKQVRLKVMPGNKVGVECI